MGANVVLGDEVATDESNVIPVKNVADGSAIGAANGTGVVFGNDAAGGAAVTVVDGPMVVLDEGVVDGSTVALGDVVEDGATVAPGDNVTEGTLVGSGDKVTEGPALVVGSGASMAE